MSSDLWWDVVVPVKDAITAKSRLQPPPGVRRRDLAHAIAKDTLLAASRLDNARLWVVTSDPQTMTYADSLGAEVVRDAQAGLNAALTLGLTAALAARPGEDTGRGACAVLLGDTPALLTSELDRALHACAPHRVAVIPDRHGCGTALLTGRDTPLVPTFGHGSAHRHRHRLGAVLVCTELPGLRCDVDYEADLHEAERLGLGPHTASLLRSGDVGAPTPCE